MERLVTRQGADLVDDTPPESAHHHKNLLFSIMYLHALLEGRRKYGVIGWNLPYEFDVGDFEISAIQLAKLLQAKGETQPEKLAAQQRASLQYI